MFGSRLRGTLGITAALLVAACSKDEMADMGSASAMQAGSMADAVEYRVVFRNAWTPRSHPFEYPESAGMSFPHYSGLIGAAHNAAYALFAHGAMPTPGLERLSEEGKHSPLDDEIRSAIASGDAVSLFTTTPLRDLNDSLVATVTVDASHPLVSVVAMIAPSPDWFAGVAGVDLRENGAWAASKTMPVFAWDAGGDDGATYRAADRDATPKKPTMQSRSRHFTSQGMAVPVGTISFTRK